MLGRSEISTEVEKGPFVFVLGALLGSLISALLLFMLGGSPLSIFAGILMSLVALAAGAVLFAMLTDAAWIREDKLYMSYLFRRRVIPLGEIGRISLKEELYQVFDRQDRPLGSINSRLKGIGTLIGELDKKGVPFV